MSEPKFMETVPSELIEEIAYWLILFGPDGHYDGADEIAKRAWEYMLKRTAAPEMYEALQHALFLLSGLSTDGEITMTPDGKDRVTAELRAALAKAEGRS